MASIIAQGQENVEKLSATFGGAPITEIATDYLSASINNPRRHISHGSIQDMVNGIEKAGGEILQPLLVRPIPINTQGQRYEVICGNRRLLAARQLGLPMVPVRVREMDDETAARFALWENLSREDLSPMDLAESINDLRRVERLSWDQIAERFGFSRQWGWKQQRLAELPSVVRDLVHEGKLSPSKAMLLAQIDGGEDDIATLAQSIVDRNLSHRVLMQELRRKHVLTSGLSEEAEDRCKHVLTWSPPRTLPRRGYARLVRAAEDLVETMNQGMITPDIARSMREIAQNILSIADRDEASGLADPPEPTPKRRQPQRKSGGESR